MPMFRTENYIFSVFHCAAQNRKESVSLRPKLAGNKDDFLLYPTLKAPESRGKSETCSADAKSQIQEHFKTKVLNTLVMWG